MRDSFYFKYFPGEYTTSSQYVAEDYASFYPTIDNLAYLIVNSTPGKTFWRFDWSRFDAGMWANPVNWIRWFPVTIPG
jgi:hypothetical protein|tara:strand:- start:200 stop:433 length:234 start_codon:yes stop_codon:yes gene_type:complete